MKKFEYFECYKFITDAHTKRKESRFRDFNDDEIV